MNRSEMTERGAYEKVSVGDLVPPIDQVRFRAGDEGSLVALAGGSIVLGSAKAGTVVTRTNGVGSYASITQSKVDIQRPLGMPDQGGGLLRACKFPDMVITRLRSAICVPGGIILRGNRVLIESFSAPWESYEHRHMISQDQSWRLRSDHSVNDVEPFPFDCPALWLDNQHLMWFGHFMLDLLTRAWAFEFCRSFLGMKRLKVICSYPVPQFGLDLFHAAGIASEDLFLFDRPIACRDLILATKALQIQEYTSPPAIRLWESIHGRAGLASNPETCIYVSRRANPTRSLVEEETVEQIFRDRGFVVVYPETISIRGQINLFGRSSLIAGCSGSNMFNLAYARRAKAAFILVSPLLVHYQEHFLAAGSDLAIEYFIGHVTVEERTARPGYVHASWHVDTKILAARVDEWLWETLGRNQSSRA